MKTFLSYKTENRRCSVGFFYFFSDCHFSSWLLLRRLHPCCGPVRRRICHFFTLSLLSLQKEQSDRCTLRLVPNESNMVGMVSRRCSHREVMRRSHRGCHARSCPWIFHKGWGQSVKLGPHSAIWGILGTALQAYTLNPCTKFPPNPTSRKVNT